MTALGVGDWVEYVGRAPNVPAMSYRAGAVRMISRINTVRSGICPSCHEALMCFWVSTDPPICHPWCPCAWRPFHGPEQAVRKCEEVGA